MREVSDICYFVCKSVALELYDAERKMFTMMGCRVLGCGFVVVVFSCQFHWRLIVARV